MRRSRAATTLLVALLVFSLTLFSSGSAPPVLSQTVQETMGPLLVVRFDPDALPSRVPPPAQFSQLGAQSATFIVNFSPSYSYTCYAWPPQAQSAFNYALSIWASLIDASVSIGIDACWRPLTGNTLGLGGPWLRLVSGTWYPMALANEFAGGDQNGSTPEIVTSFNSIYTWYYGTDGNPGSGQVDFVSVVLHEIGHGLGFTGSMDVVGGVGSWGSYPSIFDRFLENLSGQNLIGTFTNGSTGLGSQLTGGGGGVFFDGPNANAGNGGSRPELYAPSTWDDGSSIYHLDESTYPSGNANALMTPTLGSQEANHDPGPIGLGILKDIGWSVVGRELSIVKQVSWSPDLAPGDPVTFTLSIQNTGTLTATGVLVTDTLPTGILSPTYDYALSPVGAITPQGVISYVWSLPDLVGGATGVITVYGTISPSLSSDFAMWNTASIGTVDVEGDTSNNESTALVGGSRAFLPLILKNSQ